MQLMQRSQHLAEQTSLMLMILTSVLRAHSTKIAKASDKVRKGAGEKVVPDSPDEAVSYIVGKLKDKHVI